MTDNDNDTNDYDVDYDNDNNDNDHDVDTYTHNHNNNDIIKICKIDLNLIELKTWLKKKIPDYMECNYPTTFSGVNHLSDYRACYNTINDIDIITEDCYIHSIVLENIDIHTKITIQHKILDDEIIKLINNSEIYIDPENTTNYKLITFQKDRRRYHCSHLFKLLQEYSIKNRMEYKLSDDRIIPILDPQLKRCFYKFIQKYSI